MREYYWEIIIAAVGCTVIFLGSHCWWLYQQKHSKKSFDLFWERPAAAILLLFIVSQWSGWNLQYFTASLIFFYLLCLGIHTWFLLHHFKKQR